MSNMKRVLDELMPEGKCFNCGNTRVLVNGKPFWKSMVCYKCYGNEIENLYK